ncbi:heavy-metal-associated domain-containing protein [Flagellimonas marinaquae]|uniref:heavy-metal-associated domain-containing protein n=1 Tax=Flagellimonas marinaquae TaxID=254955 RepID=UPI002075F40B|nr:cation transporter [Allomuricauda aquimarina]USD24812.1 cation transporter [Allomuricauda aquimarina]
MKRLLSIFVFLLISAGALHAQDKNKKDNFEVKGNCGMCKARIEKASIKLKGVKYASWDVESKELSVIYNEAKCSLSNIKEAISKVGHDTDEFTADDKVYEKLPACCKYRDPNSMLMDHSMKY